MPHARLLIIKKQNFSLFEVIHEPLMPFTDQILPGGCGLDCCSH